jgi:ParB family transcriptional regulator, chromosome partitioning protein
MTETAPVQRLRLLAPSQIQRNPENPRLVFRQEEMESLMLSIDKHGIQVPVAVYQDGDTYRLIDGERRWRCATKLNLKAIPALIQAKPSELQNLVLMYNIHALREQWDYYTIASKLQRVIELYSDEYGITPNESTLSELTGLTRGAIRRCQLLLDLPQRFQNLLLDELEKPKSQQKLSEDFFIEMEKSLKAVTRRIPEYYPQIDEIRDTLVGKFQSGLIPAVTDFRQLSKIATAIDGLGIAQRTARRALDKVFDPREHTGIREAYSTAVEFEYGEQRASKYLDSLAEFLDSVVEEGKSVNLDDEFMDKLRQLYGRLRRLFEA